jgi:proton-dependent oligopeptide transporter, POT family
MCLGLTVYLCGLPWLAPDKGVANAIDNPSADEARPLREVCRQDWPALLGISVTCFFAIIFWAVYEQQGNTVQLFAVNYSDMMLFPGVRIPATWIQSLNPFFILGEGLLINPRF